MSDELIDFESILDNNVRSLILYVYGRLKYKWVVTFNPSDKADNSFPKDEEYSKAIVNYLIGDRLLLGKLVKFIVERFMVVVGVNSYFTRFTPGRYELMITEIKMKLSKVMHCATLELIHHCVKRVFYKSLINPYLESV